MIKEVEKYEVCLMCGRKKMQLRSRTINAETKSVVALHRQCTWCGDTKTTLIDMFLNDWCAVSPEGLDVRKNEICSALNKEKHEIHVQLVRDKETKKYFLIFN